MNDGIVEIRPTNFDFSQIQIIMLNWLIPKKIDSLTNFWVIVNFGYLPCDLKTKYGHKSVSTTISRIRAGVDDKIYISKKIIQIDIQSISIYTKYFYFYK